MITGMVTGVLDTEGIDIFQGAGSVLLRRLIKRYSLKAGSKVLDAGCGKGYLLYEMILIEPGLEIAGFDLSRHGLSNAKEEIRDILFRHDLKEPFPFEDDNFDLVVSLGMCPQPVSSISR